MGYVLPTEVLTSIEIEEKLSSTYKALGRSKGSLAQMTGVQERRVWSVHDRPSQFAAQAGRLALDKVGMRSEEIDLLIFTGVCKDFIEPATACIVHKLLNLSDHCVAFDLGNACLGFMSGLMVAASQIELGLIRSALIVTGENAAPLYAETMRRLNEDPTEEYFRSALASFTLGSAAVACVLTRSSEAEKGPALLGGMHLVESEHNHLCCGEGGPAAPSMRTDTAALMKAGLNLSARNLDQFLALMGWSRQTPNHLFTHQVSERHHQLLFERLALEKHKGTCEVPLLGNTGSAAAPLSLAMAMEKGKIQAGQNVAMLGIGSGLVGLMIGIRW